MASNESFAAAADLSRKAAFVEANEATKCIRCDGPGPLVKQTKKGLLKGLCFTCSERRTATIRADEITPEREAPRPATTIASLLGNGGMPVCASPVLDWCNQSMSARASMGEVFKKLGSLETFLILHPRNVSAWDNYERRYAAIENFVKAIRTVEDKVAQHYPDLKREPIYIPQKLERASAPAWLSV